MKMTQAMKAWHRDLKNAVLMDDEDVLHYSIFCVKSSRKLFYSPDKGKAVNVF